MIRDYIASAIWAYLSMYSAVRASMILYIYSVNNINKPINLTSIFFKSLTNNKNHKKPSFVEQLSKNYLLFIFKDN